MLGLEPRLTREGTEEALLLRREPFLLRAEPLLLSMESLLLRAEARPDREDLPESIFPDNAFPDSAFPASGAPKEPLPGRLVIWLPAAQPRCPSACWRIQALTSMRLRGVVRSAEAIVGSERTLRILSRLSFPSSGALSAAASSCSCCCCCASAAAFHPVGEDLIVSPLSGELYCRPCNHLCKPVRTAAHASQCKALWQKLACCVLRALGEGFAEVLGSVVCKGSPATGVALEGALYNAIARAQLAAQLL